jgi:hypothetical protein
MRNNNLIARYRLPLQSSASMAGLLLTPVAGIAAALGAWKLTSDPGWTGSFFIRNGLLSRYQFWFAASIGAQTAAVLLKRWANQRRVAPVLETAA